MCVNVYMWSMLSDWQCASAHDCPMGEPYVLENRRVPCWIRIYMCSLFIFQHSIGAATVGATQQTTLYDFIPKSD